MIDVPDERGARSASEEEREVAEETPMPRDEPPSPIPPDIPDGDGPGLQAFDSAAPMHHLPECYDCNDEALEESAGKEDISDLAREWILLQLGKVCSNEVSDAYFSMAWDMCEVFMRCKQVLKTKPVLKSLRRKIIQENVPGIKLDYII